MADLNSPNSPIISADESPISTDFQEPQQGQEDATTVGVVTPEYVDNFGEELQNEQKYGDSPITAAALSGLDSATFSIGSRILKKLGVATEKDLQQYQAQNPAADIIGNVGGIIIPAIASGGSSILAKAVAAPVGTAIKAGTAVEKAVSSALAKSVAESSSKKIAKEVIKKSVAANLAAKAAGGAAEGAIFGAGAALREDALGTAELNSENLISQMGTGALFGGALGGTLPLANSVLSKTGKSGKQLFDKAVSKFADPQEAALEYVGATPATRARLASHTSGQAILENLPKILVEDGKISATNSTKDVLKNLNEAQNVANSQIDSIITQIDNSMESAESGTFQRAKETFLPIAKQVNKDFVSHYEGKGPAFSGTVNKAKKIVNSLNIMAGQPEYVSVQKLQNKVANTSEEIRQLKNIIRKENAAANRELHEAGFSKIAKLNDELALTEKQLEEHVLSRTKRNTDRGMAWDAESLQETQLRNSLEARAAKLKNSVEQESANFHAPTDSKTFYNKMQEVLSNPNPMFKANITPYTEAEYRGFKTFLSSDGKSGYAIKPDGELISVFSTVKGRGERLVDDAIRNKGATKLDAFDINNKLPELYGKHMRETSRLKFADEFAPPGWDYATLGRPDIVQMSVSPSAKGLKRAATENESRLAQLQAEYNHTTAQHQDLLKNKKWARKVKASELRELKQDFDELAKSFYDNMKPSEASKAAYEVRKMMNDALKSLANRISPKVAQELEAATLKSHQLIETIDMMAKQSEKPSSHANMDDLILGVGGSLLLGPKGLLIAGGKKLFESDLKRKLIILSGIEKANKRVSSKISTAASEFMKKASGPSRLGATYLLMDSKLAESRNSKAKPKTELEAFNNISENLNHLVTNTDELLMRTVKAGAPLSVAAPQTAQAVSEKLATMVQFLHSKIPKRPYETSSIFKTTRPYVPSSIELSKFNRYLQAAENPMSIFDELAAGSITKEHIDALKAVYPDINVRLQAAVLEHLRDTDEEAVSYQKRVQLGMLLDVPTDDSMMGQNIAALQQNFNPQMQAQEGAAVGAPKDDGLKRDANIDIAERKASMAQGFESKRS